MLPRLAVVTAVLAALAAYLLQPELRAAVNEAVALVVRADIAPLREYLLSFGPWAVVVSVLLQIITSVLAPLPSFVVTFVNAFVFGFWWGVMLTFSSALLASAICFGIARILGRPVVERLATRRALEATDGFFVRHGLYAVLIARLIPFVNPDVISYAAGLTSLRWRVFLISIALGSIPSTLLYSYLGASGVTAVGWLLIPLVGLGLLTLAIALLRSRSKAGERLAGPAAD
ncbi:MAG: TVP38/TMEM64 family protein [Truepera sp.]|nr:TVP38/TMEM64 family protein [Truepera sp.]